MTDHHCATCRADHAEDQVAVLRDTLTARTEALHRVAAENDQLRGVVERVTALAEDDKRHLVRWIDSSHLVDVSDLKAALEVSDGHGV